MSTLDPSLRSARTLTHSVVDYFEVVLLLGACFLVNYVTADQETNISEGATMMGFYAMIVSVFLTTPDVLALTQLCATGDCGVVLSWTAGGRLPAQLSGQCRAGRSGGGGGILNSGFG